MAEEDGDVNVTPQQQEHVPSSGSVETAGQPAVVLAAQRPKELQLSTDSLDGVADSNGAEEERNASEHDTTVGASEGGEAEEEPAGEGGEVGEPAASEEVNGENGGEGK
eukprot:3275759-Rhodomonas_salina.3